jgi:hypothetical protein
VTGIIFMNTFTINLPLNSYLIEDNNVNQFGEISVQIAEFVFPSKDWTDFGAVILFWWLHEISDLMSEKDVKRIQCKFMDGNFRFDVEETDSINIWKVYFIREKSNDDEIEQEANIDAERFTDELLGKIEMIKELGNLTQNIEGVERIEKLIKSFKHQKRRYFN